MGSAADGDLQPLLGGEPNRRLDVGLVETVCDQSGRRSMLPFQTRRLSSYAASVAPTTSPRMRVRRQEIGLSAVCVMTSSSGN